MIVAQFHLKPLPISLICVEELCIAQRSQMQAIRCDREIMSWKLRALLSPHGRPCTFILLSCCCLQPSQVPSCLLWAWANAFSWIPLTAKYPQVNLKHLSHFLQKTLWNEGGRQGQMEYLNLISDFQFFISLILMYVIEHCHTINQHPNIPQKYKTNAFEKIKSYSKQTPHFKVWGLDNLSKWEECTAVCNCTGGQ